MVDKGASTAGTNPIHALLRRFAKISYFGILTAEFHNSIGLRNEILYRCRTSDNLLHKRQADTLCNSHASRPGQGKGEFTLTHNRF